MTVTIITDNTTTLLLLSHANTQLPSISLREYLAAHIHYRTHNRFTVNACIGFIRGRTNVCLFNLHNLRAYFIVALLHLCAGVCVCIYWDRFLHTLRALVYAVIYDACSTRFKVARAASPFSLID